MSSRTVAACLGCVALSANVTVTIAPEALFDPAGAVVELPLVNLAVPYHSGIDNSISHFWIYKFKHNGGCVFMREFLGQPSHIGDLCFGNHSVVLCHYLLDSRFLIVDIDGIGWDAVYDDPVC